jgi:hypothetical protein
LYKAIDSKNERAKTRQAGNVLEVGTGRAVESDQEEEHVVEEHLLRGDVRRSNIISHSDAIIEQEALETSCCQIRPHGISEVEIMV